VWDPVTWTKCWCGQTHSNRRVPEAFWDREWTRSDADITAGILLFKTHWPTPFTRKGTGATFTGRPYHEYFMVESYGNGINGMPKGKVEPGDKSEWEAAKREFYEETGTRLDIDRSEFVQRSIHTNHCRGVIFIAEVPLDFEIPTRPGDNVEITSMGFTRPEYSNVNWLTTKTIVFLHGKRKRTMTI